MASSFFLAFRSAEARPPPSQPGCCPEAGPTSRHLLKLLSRFFFFRRLLPPFVLAGVSSIERAFFASHFSVLPSPMCFVRFLFSFVRHLLFAENDTAFFRAFGPFRDVGIFRVLLEDLLASGVRVALSSSSCPTRSWREGFPVLVCL